MRTERPPRCERPKVENGRPCKRAAGAGTDHAGVGPCSLHDDGSWLRPSFGENVEARAAFLAAVSVKPLAGIRELVEPLGYHRRDVVNLLERDDQFRDDYADVRGDVGVDDIRRELEQRAFDRKDAASAKLLEFIARMRLPEAENLQRARVDGRVEVDGIEIKLAFEPRFAEPPDEEQLGPVKFGKLEAP